MIHTNSYEILTYIQSLNIVQTARLYNNQQKKKKRTCKILDFTVLADHRAKLNESEKKDNYLDLAWGLKKLWNLKVMFIPIVIGALGTITNELLKGVEDLGITSNWTPSNYCFIGIGQNTDKSAGDLRRFALTQTSVKYHQLSLM